MTQEKETYRQPASMLRQAGASSGGHYDSYLRSTSREQLEHKQSSPF